MTIEHNKFIMIMDSHSKYAIKLKIFRTSKSRTLVLKQVFINVRKIMIIDNLSRN